ncbi:MAG: hypothetical protein K2Q97_02565, partial [Burkholderiaceae bacterium]|nr:hypothetical protein [Burkholderiaceae bacterium]
MATSGTYNFNLTRDDVIKASLRLTTKFGAGETIPAEDIVDCAQSLNILCKELAIEGLPLWCVKEIVFPTVAGQASYELKTLGNSGVPLRVLDIYIRNRV